MAWGVSAADRKALPVQTILLARYCFGFYVSRTPLPEAGNQLVAKVATSGQRAACLHEFSLIKFQFGCGGLTSVGGAWPDIDFFSNIYIFL